MRFTDRNITKQELESIYDDFKKIERLGGVPDAKQERHQFAVEENGMVIAFVSGLTNHKRFFN